MRSFLLLALGSLLLLGSEATAQVAPLLCGTSEGSDGEAAGPNLPPYISTTGNFRAIVAYVRFADDTRPWTTCGPNDWPANAPMPAGGHRLLDSLTVDTFDDPESLTSYFLEQSSGAFRVYGDEYGVTVGNEEDYLDCTNPNSDSCFNYNKTSPTRPNITRDIFQYLQTVHGVDFSQYDADSDNRLDHLFVVIRTSGQRVVNDTTTFSLGIANCPDACASGESSVGNPIGNYNVIVDNQYSGSFNLFQSIEPLRDNVLLLAHEMGHDIWGGDHLRPFPRLASSPGNGAPFFSPDGTAGAGDRYVSHALMVSRGNSAGRVWENHMTSAAERAYVASTISNSALKWITCPAPTNGATYSLGDVQTTGGCLALGVGGSGTNIRELYLSNMQRSSPFNEMRYPIVNPGGGPCLVCAPIEWGTPTTGLVVEYVSRTENSRTQWERDIVPADERLSDFGLFPGCGLYQSVAPTAEEAADGDFWRPGIDRQLTPWTRPNVFGHHDLTTVSADALATGLHAIDDIRSGTGGQIKFEYYQQYPSQPIANVRRDWWVTTTADNLAIFNELRVEAGVTLTVEPGAHLTLNGNLVVEPGGRLDLRGTLRFGPAAALIVQGNMTSIDGEMVALDPVLGWRGVRIEAPLTASEAPGAIDDPTVVLWTGATVSDVEIYIPPDGRLANPAAVVVFGRELRMTGGRIEGTRNGSGLYVASGITKLSGTVELRENSLYGLVAGTAGSATTSGPQSLLVTLNAGGGVMAVGQSATVSLDNATINLNQGVGVEATAGGFVQFSATNRVTVSNNQGGLSATSGGAVFAGDCSLKNGVTTCTAPANGHSIASNTPSGLYFDARALTRSVLYAEGNQWGLAQSPRDLKLVADSRSFLSVCPFWNVSPDECDGGMIGGRTAALGTDRRAAADDAARGAGLAAPLFALASTLLADGDTLAAAAAVLGALDAGVSEDERIAAFEAAARLAALVQPPSLVARLVTESAPEAAPETRPWAVRALVAARAGEDDALAAGTLATLLVDGYAGTEHAVEGWAARVRLAVEASDEGAALSAYDALVPLDSLAAAGAGALVAAAFTGEDSGGARFAGRGAAPETVVGEEATSRVAGAPAEIEVGRVAPNPVAGAAALVVGLPRAAQVAVEVYDALGRRVLSSSAAEHTAGYHRLSLAAGRMAPGVYVARVRVASPGAALRVEARRFVVVR